MKVFVIIFENNGWRDIGGIFSTKQKAHSHLQEVLDRFPRQRWEIEEWEVL